MNTDINERVGIEIRRLRQAKGMSMRVLAQLVGVSHPYIADVERGRRSIRKRLPAVAQALGVDAQHFASINGVCPTCGGTGRQNALDPEEAP